MDGLSNGMFGIVGLFMAAGLYALINSAEASVAEKDQFDSMIGRGEGMIIKLDQNQARGILPLAEEVVLVSQGGQEPRRQFLACVTGADGQVSAMLGHWDGTQVHPTSLEYTSEAIYANRCYVETK